MATNEAYEHFVKLRVGFWRNHKIKLARKRGTVGERAVALYAMALSYVGETKQDGFVDPEWLTAMYPDDSDRAQLVAILLNVGLWKNYGDGWEIHDYLKHQTPSEVQAVKRQNGRNAAAARRRQPRTF